MRPDGEPAPGPLVAGAVILASGQVGGDPRPAPTPSCSPPLARDRVYEQILKRAVAWSVVSIDPGECDTLGMHQANLAALRRALLRLQPTASFALTDGFGVDGLGMPEPRHLEGRPGGCLRRCGVRDREGDP